MGHERDQQALENLIEMLKTGGLLFWFGLFLHFGRDIAFMNI